MTAINETFKLLPPEAKQEVVDFVEFIARKYLKKKPKVTHPKKEILSFAGSWKDLDENDFQSLISDIYERREKSFTRRRNL
jgi:hypothetical protein